MKFFTIVGRGSKTKNAWFLKLKSILGHTESFCYKNLGERSAGVPIANTLSFFGDFVFRKFIQVIDISIGKKNTFFQKVDQ